MIEIIVTIIALVLGVLGLLVANEISKLKIESNKRAIEIVNESEIKIEEILRMKSKNKDKQVIEIDVEQARLVYSWLADRIGELECDEEELEEEAPGLFEALNDIERKFKEACFPHLNK